MNHPLSPDSDDPAARRGNGTVVKRPDPRRKLGAAGEAMAVRILEEAGLTIVMRNWRCTAGELDIVAQEIAPNYVTGETQACWLVCVEVRTRRGERYGTARQSLSPHKQAKLREVAAHYVQQMAWTGPWRIDLLAIQMDAQGHLQAVEHIRHAVTG
jgi:putative endonuclease